MVCRWLLSPGFNAEYLRLATSFRLPMDQKIKNLSKGMRAKVVLSLAMAHKPPLLILDEPTSGLDTLVRRERFGPTNSKTLIRIGESAIPILKRRPTIAT